MTHPLFVLNSCLIPGSIVTTSPLVNVCNSTDPDVIWGFIKEYDNKLD